MTKNFSDSELDALREFVNISTAHSATALSKMVDKAIDVQVPQMRLVPVPDIPRLLGGADAQVVGLYFRISGNMSGSMLILFPKVTAQKLVELLLAGIIDEEALEFKGIEKSALMELGNVLTNSYLNALAELLNIRLLLSVPHYAEDELGSVMDLLLIELVEAADYALMMGTTITLEGTNLAGHIIMFPDNVSLDMMLNKIGTH
jgi:chemotaxis protein CheC